MVRKTPRYEGSIQFGHDANAAPPSRFQADDILTVTAPDIVESHEILFRIQEDGTIWIPSIGRIVAAGRTSGDLRTEIIQKDTRYRRGAVYLCSCDLAYLVTGEVKASGPKFFKETVTLSEALSAAGGFTKSADTNSVQLIRSAGHRETIRLTGNGPTESRDPPIYSRDIIEVKRRSIFSR